MGNFLSLFGSLAGRLQMLEKLLFMLRAVVCILMRFFQSQRVGSLKPYGPESSTEQVGEGCVAAMVCARI